MRGLGGTESEMSTSVVSSTVTELTTEQASAMFERRCREELGVSSEEFLAAIAAGELPSGWSPEAASRLEMLLPFVR